MVSFLLSNLFISGIIVLLLVIRRLLRYRLTSHTQYQLWFLLLGLLAVPFLPFHPDRLLRILSRLNEFTHVLPSDSSNISNTSTAPLQANMILQVIDFALSIDRSPQSMFGILLFGIWVTGILVMFAIMLRAHIRLITLRRSALPLQNEEVLKLYKNCLAESHVKRAIPIYSTAFLSSPIMTGLFRPRIYLPIHLISDHRDTDLRYILLHELQHYRRKDILGGYFIYIACILYWFNPFVLYAMREMYNDREIACDASVLSLLDASEYRDYGEALIYFLQRISLRPFPFIAGISGNMKLMTRRISKIASYRKPTLGRKLQNAAILAIIAALLFPFSPLLSVHAFYNSSYVSNSSIPETSAESSAVNLAGETVIQLDLSAYFEGYNGSFVLFDSKSDLWRIYNMEYAASRISPDSTYKIYTALFGLEKGIITPDNSSLLWDNTEYPFEEWNADQDLYSAMTNSVNWYFQAVDEHLGSAAIKHYLHEIGYGNEDLRGGLSTYWLESSLKISPIEQVKLLSNLYNNTNDFSAENINAVKESILLAPFEDGNLYGKTGTGRINGQDINGWFIGFVETSGNTCFFATNIQSPALESPDDAIDIHCISTATGSKAAEITSDILQRIIQPSTSGSSSSFSST